MLTVTSDYSAVRYVNQWCHVCP